jgi:Flp pilus assembly protein TadG
MPAIPKALQRRRGQSMVEFALIVPLLLMLLFGIIELGILFSVYVGMTNSAREAARAGSVYQYTGTPFVDDGSTPGAAAAFKATVDGQRQQYLSQVISDTLNPIVDPATVQTTVTYTSTSVPAFDPDIERVYRSGDIINVLIVHDHPLFFGILGPQTITIKATSAMRIEPGGTR